MKHSAQIAFRVALLAILVASPLSATPDDETTPQSQPTQSLDQQLLDDLNADLGLGGASQPPPTKQLDQDLLDQDLLDQLGQGEDLQPGSAQPNPLADIARRMRQVQTRIGAANISGDTRTIQDTIVSDLSALIEQCQKQCQACKSCSASQGNKPGQPKPQAGKSAARASKPTDSIERLGKEDAKQAYLDSMRALIKETWGHLPDRAREPMINSGVDRFVPEYEEIIEDYFRRLAQQQESRK